MTTVTYEVLLVVGKQYGAHPELIVESHHVEAIAEVTGKAIRALEVEADGQFAFVLRENDVIDALYQHILIAVARVTRAFSSNHQHRLLQSPAVCNNG